MAELLAWEWQGREPYLLGHRKSIPELQRSFGFPCARWAREAPRAQSWPGQRPQEAQAARGPTAPCWEEPSRGDNSLHRPSPGVKGEGGSHSAWLKGPVGPGMPGWVSSLQWRVLGM